MRDVAMKRLRFIDDYCRVNVPQLLVCLWGASPSLSGVEGHDPCCLSQAVQTGGGGRALMGHVVGKQGRRSLHKAFTP